MIEVTCTTAVSYGDEVDCQAASVDGNGNFGVPGTFTFDPGHVVAGHLVDPDLRRAPPIRTVRCPPRWRPPAGRGAQDLRRSRSPSWAPTARPRPPRSRSKCHCGPRPPPSTAATADQPCGTVVHCVMSVTDGEDVGHTKPAPLPAGVAGMTATSSDPGDVITYDTRLGRPLHLRRGRGRRRTRAAASRVALGTMHGLRTLTADLPRRPGRRRGRQPGARARCPTASGRFRWSRLSCPTSVPAEHPQTTCGVIGDARPTRVPVPRSPPARSGSTRRSVSRCRCGTPPTRARWSPARAPSPTRSSRPAELPAAAGARALLRRRQLPAGLGQRERDDHPDQHRRPP